MKNIISSFSLVVALCFSHNSTAQEFVLKNGIQLKVASDKKKTIISNQEKTESRLEIDGELMHSFLIGSNMLSVQTTKSTYHINGENLSIEEEMEIPENLRDSDYYYYFKYDSLTFEISFSGKYYLVKYYHQPDIPLKFVSSSYRQDFKQKKRQHQAVWDLRNQTFYVSFHNSSGFYVIDLAQDKMMNGRALSKLSQKNTEGLYWFWDSKKEQVYVLGAKSSGQGGKLFSFPDGLPEPEETWISGGVKMSRDDTIWEDHNLLVGKIPFQPRYIFNGKWVK